MPQAYVNVATRRIRYGRRAFDWSEITQATLIATGRSTSEKRGLTLVLEAPGRRRIPIRLRGRRGVLRPSDAELAAKVVEGSSIRMPRADDDPKGAFSRWNFPTNVSKEDALALLADPPGAGDPLPIPQ